MLPFLAALSQSAGVILDKFTLTRRQVEIHVFVPLLFLFLFLITLMVYPFLGSISPDFFLTKNLLLFLLMIVCAIIWNFFYYKGVQSEKVQQFELILMFQPLLTIVLASLFLKGENNLRVDIAAIVAAIFLILAQVKKHHFEFSPGIIDMFFAVIFMSVELIIIRLVLNFLSPVALYCLRTGIIFLFFYLYYRPRIFRVCRRNWLLIFANAFLSSAQMIMKFYGFEAVGVVYTSLVLLISPLIVNFVSIYYFHERLHFKKVVAAAIILLCIVYATAIGK